MVATSFSEVIESFESSFMDKKELPDDLVNLWLIKAIGDFSTEISPLKYNKETQEFEEDLDRYVIDTLAKLIKIYYLERTVSYVDKVASVVGKDLSVNGQNGLQNYTHKELDIMKSDIIKAYNNLKPTAYN